MVEVDEGILGPDPVPQFFPGDQLPRSFREGRKDLERLFLAAYPNSILTQLSNPQIQYESAKTNGRSIWIGHSHCDLGVFDATAPKIVIWVNGNSSVLTRVTHHLRMS
jgi:hypothetical protein